MALAVVFSGASAGSADLGGAAVAPDPWYESRPLAVRVEGGRASFDIPASTDGAKSLVIVSNLGTSGGPSPIRLNARPVVRSRPFASPPIRRRKPASLDLPKLAPTPGPVAGLPPSRKTFHLPRPDGDLTLATSYARVDGRLAAVGRRVQVYVDADDLGRVGEATMRDLVESFDETIYPRTAARFGPAADVDRDGRFTVLFSGKLAGGKDRVDGFFRGADLEMGLGEPFGNRCDLMTLSTSLEAGPHLRTIVAHEYTHAVGFSRKVLEGGPGSPEESGWLDEGVAHLVEDELGFSASNIDYRVGAFLSRPERYRLVVEDYYSAGLYRSHGNRGATYLFLRWCVDRHGPGLLDALVRSNLRGVANLEAATGSSFADLFRDWTVALALSGLDPASSLDEAYRSIDLRGELGGWILAGPRMSRISTQQPSEAWVAEPTSTHFAVVESPPGVAVAVELAGPPGSELQVTALRLPADLGRPVLKVRTLPEAGDSPTLGAEVVEHGGVPVRLGALAWEPLVPPGNPGTNLAARGGLDGLGIARTFASSALPAGGALKSPAIRLDGIQPRGGPMVFKMVGIEPEGRRTTARAELAPSPSSAVSTPRPGPGRQGFGLAFGSRSP